MRWGLTQKPAGKPAINIRSEGKRSERGRCLAPASHYLLFAAQRLTAVCSILKFRGGKASTPNAVLCNKLNSPANVSAVDCSRQLARSLLSNCLVSLPRAGGLCSRRNFVNMS